jgi:serine/threonine-protein kinase
MYTCPGDDTITLFTCGGLEEQDRTALEGHLADCASCRKVVGVLRTALPHLSADAMSSGLLAKTGLVAPGTAIGRYRIQELVGAGGMGVVYGAFDPDLDRKVALKLLYPTLGAGDGDLARLRHESKAMARLKHENVATIHDIGSYHDQLYLVLEYVEGATLRAWVGGDRPWTTVLDTFVAAGRGLAAAHEAGIVHCDFKPDNVLIAGDGRPVVTDFGLAQIVADTRAHAVDAPPTGVEGSFVQRTAHGQLFGTPAYMAPERFDAATAAGVQGDVFAFCVSLHEVLYGQRPFAGTTLAEVRASVESGAIVEPPASDVPAWIHRVLARGLSSDLAVRHASMTELLAELAPKPRRRTLWWAVAATVVLAGGAAAWLLARGDEPATCDARSELAGTWDAGVRARVGAALTAGGAFDAARDRIQRALDRYADAWVRTSDEMCSRPEATEVQRRCLRTARIQLRTLTEQLALGGAPIVKASDRAVGELPSIDDCTTAAAGRPEPSDPAVRAEVDQLRDELDVVLGLDSAAKFDAAKSALDGIAPRADKTGYRPLQAEVQFVRARILRGTAAPEAVAEAFRDAAAKAEAAGHDVLAVKVWSSLAFDAGQARGDFARGREYATYAAAALVRIGGDARLEEKLAGVRGAIEWRDGKFDAARREFQRELVLAGNDPAARVEALAGLGHVDEDSGHLADALAEQLAALDLRRSVYGDDNPEVARSYTGLGSVMMKMGKSEDSLAYYRKAEDVTLRAFGPKHTASAIAAHNVGGILRDLERPVEAEQEFRRAVAIFTAAFGPEHPYVAKSQDSLGMALFDQKRYPEAIAELEHSVAVRRKAYGEDHVETIIGITDLGIVLREAGRTAEAIALAEKSVAGMTKVYGADNPETALAMLGQARALIAGHRKRDAAAVLDRAEAIFKKGEAAPQRLTEIDMLRVELAKR